MWVARVEGLWCSRKDRGIRGFRCGRVVLMCARQCAVDARHQYLDGRDDDDARGVCLIRSLEMIVVWTSSRLTSERHVRTEPLAHAEKQPYNARSSLVTSLRH